MIKVLKLLPIVFLYLGANERIVFSETQNTSCNIEFEKLVLDGLVSHPSIEMSKEVIKSAEFEVESAKWGYYPSPTVDFSYKSGDKKRTVARLDQPLWTGGKIDSAYDKAKAMQKQSIYELDENRYKLIENYVDALREYLKTKDKIKALNHNKKKFYELSEMVDRFMSAGELSQTDKNLLNSRIASLSSDLIITKSKHKIALVQMELLTGKKINCEINYTEKEQLQKQLNIDKLVADLQESHPSLKVIDAKVLKAIAEVDNAKSQLWPTLNLRGEHTRGTIYDESEPETENLVYLNLTMSTGAGLSGVSNIDKAKIEVTRTKFEKNTKQKELLDLMMADYTNYITATSHLEMVKEDIKVAELIYESNQRLFTSQKKSWLDLVNSLSELNKQKVKYAELLVDKEILAYKLALKTGKVNLKTLEVLSDI